MCDKVVYLMRGLPSCGKSFTARKLAGANGVVLETDEFFYTQVGSDTNRYDWVEALLPAARAWNLNRFRQALLQGLSPIVVDRGNGLNRETQEYAQLAVAHHYGVDLKEPGSPWWLEIRLLLGNKESHRQSLDQWADRLAATSRTTHRGACRSDTRMDGEMAF
jgi:hypothetical protein